MEIWKLVSGILCIVMSFFILFQSCAAGLFNALSSNGEVSGTAGLLVAALVLVGGIVSITTRYSLSNVPNIALIVLFGLAALIGFMMAGSYADLVIWATWSLICAVTSAVSLASDNVCDAPVYVVIVLVGIVLAGAGIGMNFGKDTGNPVRTDGTAENRTSGDTSEDLSNSDGKSVGSGDLGDSHVEIKGASLSEDREGNAVIVITYAWTNNSEETTSAMVSTMGKAFQDGIELDRAYSADGFDSSGNSKDVRPGSTIDVQCAYVLTSTTSTVEFEVTEWISLSDAMVSMDFDPANLG